MTPPHRTNPLILVGLPVLAVALAGLALYVALVRAPSQAAQAEQQELLLKLTGLSTQVVNKLDAKFTDADGDLLADPPTDPAQLIDPPTLFFSYVAADEPEIYQAAFKEYCEGLAKATGKKVEYVLFRSADEELKAMRDGQLHVAGFNTGNVPKAVNTVGFHPFAVAATAEGNGLIRSVLVAGAGTDIKSLADLRGKEITLTDSGSNSGYRVPLVMLKNAGLLPIRDYNIRYSGGHNESIEQLASGQAAVAAVASDLLDRAAARGTLPKSKLVELASSETFPGASIGVVHTLKPELAAKIREFTLSFAFAGTGLEKELGAGGAAKFAPVNYKDAYALVRRIDDDTGVIHKLEK